MQSTGQTSTQALSFTLMQGSAMIYGIRASRALASIWSDHALSPRPVFCVKHSERLASSSRVLRVVPRGSLSAQPRIEGVAKRIAEQIEREDREADRQPGKHRHPRSRFGEF